MVLSELSLLTMLKRALLCPPHGQQKSSGHVSGLKIGTTQAGKQAIKSLYISLWICFKRLVLIVLLPDLTYELYFWLWMSSGLSCRTLRFTSEAGRSWEQLPLYITGLQVFSKQRQAGNWAIALNGSTYKGCLDQSQHSICYILHETNNELWLVKILCYKCCAWLVRIPL